jgi:Uncharacterized protein conserved in bacteria
MSISANLLPEFEHEMRTTRLTLERIPNDKFNWAPHEKSMSFGSLASHLADIPSWVCGTINHDSLDLAPPDGPARALPQPKSREEVLELFDMNVASARQSLAGASDEVLLADWSLLAGGKNLLTMPRVGVIRKWVLNHTIHHRAQLSVYLRLNNIPVPAIYGPSADENGM